MHKTTILLAALLAQGAGAAAQDGVAAHFGMELGAGNTVTESVSGRSFAVAYNLAPESVAGAVGRALRLDGYSTYVSAQIDTARLSPSALSVSLWCAPETYPVMSATEAVDREAVIAGNIDDASRTGFAFTLTPQGDYGFRCYTGGWPVTLKAGGKMPRYEWSHLVATVDADGRSAALYCNGELVARGRCLSPVNAGRGAFMIGKGGADVTSGPFLLNTFNGLIDDITVFSRVLTQAEAAAPEPGSAPDLSIPPSRHAADIMRPAFHGMPATAWTNECHGMAYAGGRFHLFFQKNANGPYMARLHWGHIYSGDLCTWHEDRIAIAPGEDYDIKGCWSGAVFTDAELTGGRPAIIYTGVDNAKATIDMALPADDNLTLWNKSASNPLISGRPEGLGDDFRDPYFFTANGRKYIIVGSSKGGVGTTTLHEYQPQTGTWSNDGRTFFSGETAARNGTFWEMPNITEIDGKWLFTVTPLGTQDGVEVHYWTGDIGPDGKFVPQSSAAGSPGKLELDGFSKDGYGLLSPTIFSHGGKTLLMGIVPDKLPAEENYRLGWAHCYSLPREISIDAAGQLVQRPYSGLEAMRCPGGYSRQAFDLNGTEPLSPVAGRKVEVVGEFVVGTADFGFNLYKAGPKAARLCYSPADNTLTVDLTSIDRIANDGGTYGGLYRSELPRRMHAGDVVKLHAYVDHSIMDVFVNDTWAFSLRLFPTDASATGVEAFADGTTRVGSLRAWNLDEACGQGTAVGVTEAAQGISLRAASGTIAYDNPCPGATVSVYSPDGRTLHSGPLALGSGVIRLGARGVCIARVTTPTASFSRKLTLD